MGLHVTRTVHEAKIRVHDLAGRLRHWAEHRRYRAAAFARARELTIMFSHANDKRARVRARDLARALSQAALDAHVLVSDIYEEIGRARFRNRYLIDAYILIEMLKKLPVNTSAWELTFTLAQARDLAEMFPPYFRRTRSLVSSLNDAHNLARTTALAGSNVSVSVFVSAGNRLPRLLVNLAISLLPATDRHRYVEEFLAELHYQRLQSRRRQLAYAVRLLTRALGLRRSLRYSARGVRERVQ